MKMNNEDTLFSIVNVIYTYRSDEKEYKPALFSEIMTLFTNLNRRLFAVALHCGSINKERRQSHSGENIYRTEM